jgi:hypothetical protein
MEGVMGANRTLTCDDVCELLRRRGADHPFLEG